MAADDLTLQEVRALAPMVLTKYSYLESSPEGLVGQVTNRTWVKYVVNAMADNDLGLQGGKASTAMILTI